MRGGKIHALYAMRKGGWSARSRSVMGRKKSQSHALSWKENSNSKLIRGGS